MTPFDDGTSAKYGKVDKYGWSMAIVICLVVVAFFFVPNLFRMNSDTPEKIGDIEIVNPDYINHKDISVQYYEKIEHLPSFLTKDIKTVCIGDEIPEPRNEKTLYLLVTDVTDTKDEVLTQAILLFDGQQQKYSSSQEFYDACMKDNYRTRESFTAIFINCVKEFIQDPDTLKSTYPSIYEYLQTISS